MFVWRLPRWDRRRDVNYELQVIDRDLITFWSGQRHENYEESREKKRNKEMEIAIEFLRFSIHTRIRHETWMRVHRMRVHRNRVIYQFCLIIEITLYRVWLAGKYNISLSNNYILPVIRNNFTFTFDCGMVTWLVGNVINKWLCVYIYAEEGERREY